jgi:hypothetical protein
MPQHRARQRVQTQTDLRYILSASGNSFEADQVVLVKQLSQIRSPDALTFREKSGLTAADAA